MSKYTPFAFQTGDTLVFNQTKVLLIQRKNEPFKGMWAIPGGFMNEDDESVEVCAIRELEEETNISVSLDEITQIGTYSKIGRDPRSRIISTAYMVDVNNEKANCVKALDDASAFQWFYIETAQNMQLAFDHNDILNDAIKKRAI